MKIEFDKKRYYEFTEKRTGIPIHIAQRFLRKYSDGGLPLTHRAPIVHIIMRNTFLINDDLKYKRWIRVFEISLNILHGADISDKNKFDSVYDIMTKELVHFEANLHITYEKAEKISEQNIPIREKYMRLMEFYTDIYEGYYKCIVSIFAISKMILNKKNIPNNIEAYIHEDAFAKTEELNKDDKGGCVPALPELCYGCNRHLRNGICHEHWKINGKNIEIWDWNKAINKEVWRNSYTLGTLKEEIDSIQETSEAMILAVILYNLSKYKSISGVLSLAPGDYDLAYIVDAMENAAFDFGLFLNDYEVSEQDNTLTIVLCVPDNHGLEYVGKIIEGSEPPRIFKVPICVVEYTVRDMVLNFLLIVSGPLTSYANINLIIADENKGEIGNFKIKPSELRDFMKKDKKGVEQILSSLQSYTVKLTREGPSIPDYPWAPLKDEDLLSAWKKINMSAVA